MSAEQKLPSDEEVRGGVQGSLKYWVGKLECGGDVEKQWFYKQKFIKKLRESDIALETDKANEQHYEVPTEYFTTVLGKWRKYSCCYWPEGVNDLEQAEEAMMKMYAEKAKLEDGHAVMDLGCGWGAMTLWVLQNYPQCTVVCVSNSQTQREYIEGEARKRGFGNRLEAVTADANVFSTDKTFDRIFSIEMFEHMRNYERLFQKVSSWLKPDGLLFTQILCHREFPYAFDTRQDADTEWMAKHFFTGGTMPSADLFLYFQEEVCLVDHWRLNGKHYTKTLDTWLEKLDANIDQVREIMTKTYGEGAAKQIFNWRMFFMFCSEVFQYKEGNEWMVSFHLFRKR
ncbi:PREDICTED: (S)-coclaurine N-methyltransferase-like [Branchiostoma belcheri]|uniref:(S)-coclaurine N-methyltransferase-like n=1 Tax=Branchiostoma belcheri TaxID=7741 RepID=A0A6P4Z6H3_BRABE|nr:PREDICTED: (S)-coclaurine N-methyltransferase-like [Branchiostoma belcheri]